MNQVHGSGGFRGGQGARPPPLFAQNLLSNVCKTQDISDPIYVIFLLFLGGRGYLSRAPPPPLWNFWIRHCTDCFGYPVADLEKAQAISFFDIVFRWQYSGTQNGWNTSLSHTPCPTLLETLHGSATECMARVWKYQDMALFSCPKSL